MEVEEEVEEEEEEEGGDLVREFFLPRILSRKEMGGERRGEGEAALVRQFQLKEVSQPSLVCRCPPPPYLRRNERTQGGIYQTYMGRRIVVNRHLKAKIWRI